MLGMLKKLLKMLTSKKVLIVATLAAIACGAYFYYKNNMSMKQDVDSEPTTEEEQIAKAVMDLSPEKISEETEDLSQSPQPVPAAPDTVENFASIE